MERNNIEKGFGVYKIENKVNGKIYIGGTIVSFEKRWSAHRATLENGQHANCLLQSDWDKYGRDCFSFSILGVVKDKAVVLGHEQEWLNKSIVSGKEIYNIRLSATSPYYRHGLRLIMRTRSHLSDDAIIEVRRRRIENKEKLNDLAKEFEISESYVSRLCNNKRRTRPRKKKHTIMNNLATMSKKIFDRIQNSEALIVIKHSELTRQTKKVLDIVEDGKSVFVERHGRFFEIHLVSRQQIGIESLDDAVKEQDEQM